MKRYFHILLIIAILLNTAGIGILFPIQQQFIKEEVANKIKRTIAEQELTIIYINTQSENELNWENDEEFRYKGNMYDVVKKKEISSGSVIYYCINDSEENDLFISLYKLIKGKSEKGNDLIKNMMGQLWTLPASKEKTIFAFYPSNTQNNFSYSSSYQFALSKSVSQPPELA